MTDDFNTLLYVLIHETAHILCPQYGHTALFDRMNLRLLEYAVLSGIYEYENYTKNNKSFGDI